MALDEHYSDPEKARQGIWFSVSGEPTEFLIRHESCEEFMRYFRENLSPEALEVLAEITTKSPAGSIERADGDQPEVDEDILDELDRVQREAYGNEILIDWNELYIDDSDILDRMEDTGDEDEDLNPDEPIEYTPERADILLDEIPQLYDEIIGVARDQSKFRASNEETDRKN